MILLKPINKVLDVEVIMGDNTWSTIGSRGSMQGCNRGRGVTKREAPPVTDVDVHSLSRHVLAKLRSIRISRVRI